MLLQVGLNQNGVLYTNSFVLSHFFFLLQNFLERRIIDEKKALNKEMMKMITPSSELLIYFFTYNIINK